MKLMKILLVPLIVIIGIILYQLPIFSSWRNFNRAVSAFKEKNFESAAASFEKVLAHHDDHQLYYNYGVSKFYAAMEKQKIAGTEVNPAADSLEIRKVETTVLETIQTLEDLITDQAKNLKSNELSSMNYLLGMLHLRLNRLDGAKTHFLEALKHDKNQKQTLLALAKLEAENDSSYVTKLIMTDVESVPISIIEKWKPF